MKFMFNKNLEYGSAYYLPFTDTIVLNFGIVLRCKTISDDEKMKFMTYQIEHEVIHAMINKLEGIQACIRFDSMAWSIQSKEDFLIIYSIAKKLDYTYNVRCKYLEE